MRHRVTHGRDIKFPARSQYLYLLSPGACSPVNMPDALMNIITRIGALSPCKMHKLRFYAPLTRTFFGANLQRGITLRQKAADIFCLKVSEWCLQLDFDHFCQCFFAISTIDFTFLSVSILHFRNVKMLSDAMQLPRTSYLSIKTS